MAPRPLPLPVRPLLAAFRRRPPDESPFAAQRRVAVRSASWLTSSLPPTDLTAHLRTFVEATLPVAWHTERIAAAGFVRHGIQHLLNGTDEIGLRFGRCVTPGGMYAVVGAGRSFWAAVWKAANPAGHPDWTADVQRGLQRCGLIDSRTDDPLATATEVYATLRGEFPPLDACDLDHFFRLVSRMTGRDFPAVEEGLADVLRHRLRGVRTRVPLRGRLKGRAKEGEQVGEGDPPPGGTVSPTDLPRKGGGGGDDDTPQAAAAVKLPTPTSPLAGEVAPTTGGSGRGVFRSPLTPELVSGLTSLDDAFAVTLAPDQQAALFDDVVAMLRQRFAVHPLEAADVIAAFAPAETTADERRPTFHGFAADTFHFLGELTEHNAKAWMDAHRERYQFVVREPLVELCAALAERYVSPVLHREYGWEMETDPRPGKALTSIAKNDYGRSGPYTPDVWVTFYRRSSGGKRHDAQLFVRVTDSGVSFGFHLGRSAREAGRRFRKAVQEQGELLFHAVRAAGVDAFTFRGATAVHRVKTAADLRAWAAEKELFAERTLPPDHPLLRSDDLVGEILIAFDRLVPLLTTALEDDPRATLARRGGQAPTAPPFDRDAFRRATFLGDTWLSRALDLLNLKKQLILHGVPGTGKTHVARSLARLLTDDRPGGVRLVQFHPGYSYEEFVEGGQPATPGVLSEFAAKAAANPALPFVLIVDEINRGNLPRIFGELLFLLEYRDQELTLPYSKRPFRLPSNLLLLGTMNSTDRSTVALDQALRRRFSFVEMTADAAVLAGWLESMSPSPLEGEGGWRRHLRPAGRQTVRRVEPPLGP